MTAMPQIHIVPIRKLYLILKESPAYHSAALIASSEPVDARKIPIPHIIQYFDDLDREVSGRSMTAAQAAEYARFAAGLDSTVHHIYCCCQSAQSRSAAMASALYRYYGDDALSCSIWENPLYSPNPLVFSLLCDALGVKIGDAELDVLIETNRQALRRAIRQ